MAQDIVEEVARIEAEADGILAAGRRRAHELEAATRAQERAARQEREQSLARELESRRQELERSAAQKTEEVSQLARQAAERLAALEPARAARAVALIVQRLREG